MKSHSYSWFPADWLQSTTRLEMTAEQRGIYRDLLDHHYSEGSLPSNEKALRMIAGVTDKEWKRSSSLVLSKFTEREGRLYNRKAEEVLNSKKEWHEKQSKSGRDGALKRWGAHSEPNGLPNGVAKQTLMHSYSNTITITNTPNPLGDDPILALAEEILERHPHPTKMLAQEIVQQFISWANLHGEDALRIATTVNENHRAICDLPEQFGGWQGKPVKFLSPLRAWLTSGKARDPTAPAKPVEAPHKPRQVIEY